MGQDSDIRILGLCVLVKGKESTGRKSSQLCIFRTSHVLRKENMSHVTIV